MIDLDARASAAQLLAAYLAGELGPSDFDYRWENATGSSSDPSLRPIGWAAWSTWDDFQDMERRSRDLTRAERDLLERCLRFLESDLPYGWDTRRPRMLERLLADPEVRNVWPFSRQPPEPARW